VANNRSNAEKTLKNPPLSIRASVRMARWCREEFGRAAQLRQPGLKLHLSRDFRGGAAPALMEKREPVFQGR